MNNKVLAVFAMLPIWVMFVVGIFSINTTETFDIIMGFTMLIFITWAGVRLFKIKD